MLINAIFHWFVLLSDSSFCGPLAGLDVLEQWGDAGLWRVVTEFYHQILNSDIVPGQKNGGLFNRACFFAAPPWNICKLIVFVCRATARIFFIFPAWKNVFFPGKFHPAVLNASALSTSLSVAAAYELAARIHILMLVLHCCSYQYMCSICWLIHTCHGFCRHCRRFCHRILKKQTCQKSLIFMIGLLHTIQRVSSTNAVFSAPALLLVLNQKLACGFWVLQPKKGFFSLRILSFRAECLGPST